MHKKNKEHNIILGTLIGLTIGTALGISLNNIAIGISTGTSI